MVLYFNTDPKTNIINTPIEGFTPKKENYPQLSLEFSQAFGSDFSLTITSNWTLPTTKKCHWELWATAF